MRSPEFELGMAEFMETTSPLGFTYAAGNGDNGVELVSVRDLEDLNGGGSLARLSKIAATLHNDEPRRVRSARTIGSWATEY